jgi:hypothetical protein
VRSSLRHRWSIRQEVEAVGPAPLTSPLPPGESLVPMASCQVGLGIGAVGVAPALQARGSHDASCDVVGLGVAIAPEVDGTDVVGLDVDGMTAVELVGLEGAALTAN